VNRFKGVDFYVCTADDVAGGGIGEDVLYAMAAGIPAILPSQFKETFGDAAVYASRDDAADVVDGLWVSRERYLAQAESGRRFVMAHCDVSSFADRLRRLPDGAER
jgi:hypothetical protein